MRRPRAAVDHRLPFLFWLNLRIALGAYPGATIPSHTTPISNLANSSSTGSRLASGQGGFATSHSQSRPRCWSLETELDGVPNAAVADLLIGAVCRGVSQRGVQDAGGSWAG